MVSDAGEIVLIAIIHCFSKVCMTLGIYQCRGYGQVTRSTTHHRCSRGRPTPTDRPDGRRDCSPRHHTRCGDLTASIAMACTRSASLSRAAIDRSTATTATGHHPAMASQLPARHPPEPCTHNPHPHPWTPPKNRTQKSSPAQPSTASPRSTRRTCSSAVTLIETTLRGTVEVVTDELRTRTPCSEPGA